MKHLIILITILITFSNCKKDTGTTRILLHADFIGEFNSRCFSQQKLQDKEIIITNTEEYSNLDDSIRMYYFTSCNNISLPEINFDSSLLIGIYTTQPGCDPIITREVFYEPENIQYYYKIKIEKQDVCEILRTSMNWAVIPIQNNNSEPKVVFDVTEN